MGKPSSHQPRPFCMVEVSEALFSVVRLQAGFSVDGNITGQTLAAPAANSPRMKAPLPRNDRKGRRRARPTATVAAPPRNPPEEHRIHLVSCDGDHDPESAHQDPELGGQGRAALADGAVRLPRQK